MKRLTCEMCGSTDLIKKDGVFECQSCGCKYSVEEAKKLMVEGVVEVKVAEPVKVDNTEKVSNLYEVARRARKNNNHEQAGKYYDLILQEEPNSWEAQFYSVYFAAMDCKIVGIANASYNVRNCIASTISIIKNSIESIQDQERIYNEIYIDLNNLTTMFLNAALDYYVNISDNIKNQYTLEFNNRAYAIESMLSAFAENILEHFSDKVFALNLANKAFANARVVCATANKEISRYVLFPDARAKRKREFNEYSDKIDSNKKIIENIILEENIINNKENYYLKFVNIGETSNNVDELEECIKILNIIGDYKDSLEHIATFKQKAISINDANDYQKAMKLKSDGNFEESLRIFKSIRHYQDSQKYIEELKAQEEQERLERLKREEQERIEKEKKKKKRKIIAISIPAVIALVTAITLLLVTVVIPKAKFKDIVAIATCWNETVALKSDGTIVSTYDCPSHWTDIVAISAGNNFIVGLKSDGTVVAFGDNDYGQCNVFDWTNIVAISAGHKHTVGLKSDGTVISTGDNWVYSWTDIVAIFAGETYTIGLKSDGTVVSTLVNGDEANWSNIVAISAGDNYRVGLKSDGTVVATGKNDYGKCNVLGWRDIVAISASNDHTVGLKSDGTVVAVGRNDSGQCNVSGWKDIVAISAGMHHTVGLKSDGTLVAVGSGIDGMCRVGGKK